MPAPDGSSGNINVVGPHRMGTTYQPVTLYVSHDVLDDEWSTTEDIADGLLVNLRTAIDIARADLKAKPDA